ncbi:MAG: NUDIX domain-containing protein [Provencibacterium sp.]|jgi:8-oxo-dGTP pyrophosphatase MutT (NUDIX family)|nr:NUDIX domain-containing protein [Provencibacterium sp.]
MRLLFEMDARDYDRNGVAFIRHSARCIYIKDGLAAMAHSIKYDYYKFPGGGIEKGESREDAMIRETREEAGLAVVPGSVKEYGYVHRIQKSDNKDADYFVQDNYYYLCEIEEGLQVQNLDAYEADEKFTLEYVEPDRAILVNRDVNHGPADPIMLEREARVLELLKKEGYFNRAF